MRVWVSVCYLRLKGVSCGDVYVALFLVLLGFCYVRGYDVSYVLVLFY